MPFYRCRITLNWEYRVKIVVRSRRNNVVHSIIRYENLRQRNGQLGSGSHYSIEKPERKKYSSDSKLVSGSYFEGEWRKSGDGERAAFEQVRISAKLSL